MEISQCFIYNAQEEEEEEEGEEEDREESWARNLAAARFH